MNHPDQAQASNAASALQDESMFRTYYAVPVKVRGASSDTDLERCMYFDSEWLPVKSDALKAKRDQDLVRIQQVDFPGLPERAKTFVEKEGYEISKTVSLFSASALTLSIAQDPLNNLYLAQETPYFSETRAKFKSWFVVLAVASKTRRGVILIFRSPIDGKPVKLIATADPEVEGSSSN